ncbi:hypothetical protein [Pseudoxanthomonas koreensis]|uniref:hypothetical protein n=1 Tax=Pseudoxanthomonas koreensis TaxID=266061 RepID=UPI0013907590|nr:hypothetical protein [Pseudoxanthomonas koreensis]
MRPRIRGFQLFALALATLVLAACAGRESRATTAKPAPAAVAKPDDRYGHRFHMVQNGKRMTADDFDAWLKAKGLRVQGGKVVAASQGASGNAAKAGGTAKSAAKGATPVANASSRPAATAKTAGAAKATKATGAANSSATGKAKAGAKEEKDPVAVTTTPPRGR